MNQEIPGKTPTFEGPACRWSSEEIRAQMNRILGHTEFHATDKMRDFLHFVVEETLAGRSEHIKGFTVATEVYGRGADFDAAHDPIVRIQAGRLRRAMERYYLVAGGQDPIRIEIPKGTYVPVFTAGLAPESSSNQTVAQPQAQKCTASWPSVLVMPFEDLTGNPDLPYLGVGLATELCVELGHCDDLRVMLHREGAVDGRERNNRPDFIISGSVRSDGPNIKIVVQLSDGVTAEQLWVDALKSPLESANIIVFQEDSANSIAAHIAGMRGVIAQAMSMHNRSLVEPTTYQAILKGYNYHHTVTPDSYMQALEALQHAWAREPECGQVCTMLALLFMDNIALEFINPDLTPLDEAAHMAREGALILPNNQFSRLVLARGHMLQNQLDLALSEVEAALALRPESLLFMDLIGYMLVFLGEWDRGEQLICKATRLNPFYRVLTRSALWLNAIRQQDYTKALEESEWFADNIGFWGPLVRAATLGLLGRPAEGREAIHQLLLLNPNFKQRGRLLIGHSVKFPELADQIIEGLELAGLAID